MSGSQSPTFSIIITDYEGSIGRDLLRRKLNCLVNQTCQDFEAIVYHDGPKKTSYERDVEGMELPINIRFVVTETRMNDWGHSNRDRGIREARGDWIIHTNADNVFYPNLIEKLAEGTSKNRPPVKKIVKRRFPIIVKSIARRVDKYFGTNIERRREILVTQIGAIVYSVRMQGLVPSGKKYQRHPSLAATHSIVFGGIPVKFGQIDAMQFVMRRDLWIKEGGWFDKSEESDGKMYPSFAEKYPIVSIPDILGEHW